MRARNPDTRCLRFLHDDSAVLLALPLLLSALACAPGNSMAGGPATGGASPGGGGDDGPSGTGGGEPRAGDGITSGEPTDASSPDATDATGGGGAGGGAELPGWRLVWADEFEGDGPPDPASWGFERGLVRNQELQWYQPENATVGGGLLTIEGRRQEVANPSYLPGSTDWRRNRATSQYTSASMTTAAQHRFMYGRFMMRARIDTRQGSWPAFWSLGAGVPWPQSGEVDIMEYYASNVLANVCRPAGATCGWSSIGQPLSRLGAAWSAAFHVWTMEWDAQKIDLSLDDVLVNHFNVADAVPAGQANPYVGKSMFLLVNLALGANGGDPAPTTFPIKYEVDWIRVYQR